MTTWVCNACGTHFAKGTRPPDRCPICEDDRQFVPAAGQSWISSSDFDDHHHVEMRSLDDHMTELVIFPEFAIGQRAIFIESDKGNVLWDCLPYFDKATLDFFASKGGLKAIAVSHPHFYGAAAHLSKEFDDCPVFLHASDAQWLQLPFASVRHWSGETLSLSPDLTLVRCGGHFPGSTVLHVRKGTGTLLTGDTISVSADRKTVSFMYSFPNRIPLNAKAIRQILSSLDHFDFADLHSASPTASINGQAKDAVMFSGTRYIRAISD